jgi:hypothetical protein
MMWLFFFLQILFVADMPLAATHIAASDVSYDGKKVFLRGSVRLQHDFGAISCDEAEIILEPNTKNLAFDTILLKGNVFVKLKDESEVRSEKADINCKTFEGLFHSDAPQKVIYTTFANGQKDKTPVKATSQAMKVAMHKGAAGSNSSYTIRDIQAIGAVIIEYQNNLPNAEGETK